MNQLKTSKYSKRSCCDTPCLLLLIDILLIILIVIKKPKITDRIGFDLKRPRLTKDYIPYANIEKHNFLANTEKN